MLSGIVANTMVTAYKSDRIINVKHTRRKKRKKKQMEVIQMQVIIEVDEDTIKSAKRDGLILAPRYRDDLTQAIRNSIVLPKGHGRLIDANSAYKKFYNRSMAKVGKEILDEVSTIIEADGGDAE